ALLLTALGSIGDGVSLFDDELRLVTCNDRFLELLALPAELGRAGTRLEDILAFQSARGDFGQGEAADPAWRIRQYWTPGPTEAERNYHGDRILRVRRRP